MQENCRENIVSEDYVDFIWKSNFSIQELRRRYPNYCIQALNDFYSVFYVEREELLRYRWLEYDYELFPKLYTPLDVSYLQDSGILQLQNQPVLNLKGAGVILGFIDTGERVIIMSS